MITSLSEAKVAINEVLFAQQSQQSFPSTNQPILIYGAGNRGKQVHDLLIREGYTVVGFMDKSFACLGTHLNLPAYPVAPINEIGLEKSNPHVIVTIFRHDIDITTVFHTLPKLGFTNISAFQELTEKFPGALGNLLWQGNRELHFKEQDELAFALTLMADEVSQFNFLECLKLRMGNPLAMQSPDRMHQYFPPDIFPYGSMHRFVDCGAYDGDSWRSANKHGIQFQSICALEPDPDNFSKLVKFMQGCSYCPAETILLPLAAWSETTLLSFGAGTDQNSHVDSSGSSIVQAIALDDVLIKYNATWLKFDIEGAEIEALKGAFDTISRNHPFLAIAVYHHADHLWKIPMMLADWNLGYKFYLRAHGYAGVDMVLYAKSA